MNNQPSRSEFSYNLSAQVELELLNAIILDDIAYPWLPNEAESEDFFTAIEQELPLSDLLTDSGLMSSSQKFFSQTAQLWSVVDVEKSLSEKFAGCVPSSLLDRLGKIAVNIVDQVTRLGSTLSLADQLVHCVSEVLPGWDLEDLEVMARPLAYSMRSEQDDAVENALATVQTVHWSDLSEVEQARLSLAIALYAISKASS